MKFSDKTIAGIHCGGKNKTKTKQDETGACTERSQAAVRLFLFLQSDMQTPVAHISLLIAATQIHCSLEHQREIHNPQPQIFALISYSFRWGFVHSEDRLFRKWIVLENKCFPEKVAAFKQKEMSGRCVCCGNWCYLLSSVNFWSCLTPWEQRETFGENNSKLSWPSLSGQYFRNINI